MPYSENIKYFPIKWTDMTFKEVRHGISTSAINLKFLKLKTMRRLRVKCW